MKGLFFNAQPDPTSPTGYDRNYNADDLSDFLSIVCDTGVVKSDVGLKVEALGGMTVRVNAGKAVIKGKGGINPSVEQFIISPNGTSNDRYDYIVVRYDNNLGVRDIQLSLVKGTSAKPTVDSLTRNDKVYELMLAIVKVTPSATTISNIEDTRGDEALCPWFTAVKGYEDYYDAAMQTHESTVTLGSISNVVTTDLPSSLYNNKYSLIEVYTNGIKEPQTAYTASASGGYIVVTFTAQKAVGSKVTVVLNNFIDGEGMGTALSQYTSLVKDVADLKSSKEINYICTGVNDNVAISNLVKEMLNDSTSYGDVRLNIIGNFKASAPVKGTGVFATPNVWFDFETESSRKVVLDFSRCKYIEPTIPNGTFNYIFHTKSNISVTGLTLIVSNNTTNTVCRVFSPNCIIDEVTNSVISVTSYKDSHIATSGTFTNCRCGVVNTINDSYCFDNYGLLRINGGRYYAHTNSTSADSAVVCQSVSNSVCIMNGVSAPTDASSGRQTYAIIQTTGYLNCHDLITELPLSGLSGQSTITGTIPLSK